MLTTNRIAIIGAGSVGSACAYALLLRRIAGEVILVDVDERLRRAQAADLSDSAFLSDCRIREGTYADAAQCDVVVITAGAKQHEGETRMDLVGRNLKILREVIDGMRPISEGAVLLLVANPVDILTRFAQEISGLPRHRVIGTGTFLDTARLRSALAEKAQVADTAVHVFVLGEHGDSQFVAWSAATIGGGPLTSVLPADTLPDIAINTRDKAYDIIAGKGSTAYGIGAVVSSICESILFNTRQVRAVSHWQEEFGCCLSMPAVIGREGVLRTVKVPLNEEEKRALERSARVIKEAKG